MVPFEMVPGNYHGIRECNIQFEEIVFIRVSQVVSGCCRVVGFRVLSGAVRCCKVLSDCSEARPVPSFPPHANLPFAMNALAAFGEWGCEDRLSGPAFAEGQ